MKTLKVLPILIICLTSLGLVCAGQNPTKEAIAKFFARVADDEMAVAACRKARDEYQLKTFGKIRPLVSGHCWEGCPTRVVKPYYPSEARRLNIRGEVQVDTIVDENGNVVFARMTKGSAYFRNAAVAAAYKSTYTPKVTCDEKPIMFR